MAVKKKVKIQVKSFCDGETIVQNVHGELYPKETSIYVRYPEPPSSSMGRTMTTVKLADSEIKVIRHGDVDSEQVFALNKQIKGSYQTPQGHMELLTMTHSMDIQLEGGMGKVSWSYDLIVANAFAGKYHITLHIQDG